MTTIGIINDPLASSGKSKLMKQMIEESSFDVIIIGPGVDMSSPEMRELMKIDGLTILDGCHRDIRLREAKPVVADRSCGPRDRWGGLK